MSDVISVKLRIQSAHKLIRRSILKYPDPFVQIFVRDQKLSTSIIEKTVNPVWNKTFDIVLKSSRDRIEVLVWNNRLFSKKSANAFLGKVVLSTDLLGRGEKRIDLSRISIYPNKSVRGYITVELTQLYSPYVSAIPSNHNISGLSNLNINQQHNQEIEHIHFNRYNKQKDQLGSTSKFDTSREISNLTNLDLALPPGFERKVSGEGNVYYININNSSIHSHHPAVPKFLRKFNDFSCLGPLPPGWVSLTSESGHIFFIDSVSRTRHYSDPRLIQILTLPDGINIVSNKLREAGKIVIDQHGCNLSRNNSSNIPEQNHSRPMFSLGIEATVEDTVQNSGTEHRTGEVNRINIISQYSEQTHSQNLLATFENSSKIIENNDFVCDNESYTLPLPRRRISRPTSDYILKNKDNIEAKLRVLRHSLKDLMLRKLCIIETSRDHILDESYLALRKLKPAEMRRRLVLKFTGEEGLDYGGVAREWLYLLSETLFSCQHGLFETNGENNGNLLRVSHLSWVNENHLSYFNFIGRVIGMAVFHGYYIDADFCKIFYKNILNKTPQLDDFKEIDPTIYKSLRWILDNDMDKTNLELTFSIDQEVFGQLTVVDLCENGRCIPVTENMKHSYVDKYVEYNLVEKCVDQYKQIKKGIFEVLPENSFNELNEDDLEVLLTGLSEINIDDWKKNTRLKNCIENEPVIKWFWDTVTSFTEQQRTKLLQFVTGSSRIPLSGFEGLRGSYGIEEPKLFTIKIIRDRNVESLPEAHTCFNRLDLPQYLTYRSLHDKLLCAIEETSGFAVL